MVWRAPLAVDGRGLNAGYAHRPRGRCMQVPLERGLSPSFGVQAGTRSMGFHTPTVPSATRD